MKKMVLLTLLLLIAAACTPQSEPSQAQLVADQLREQAAQADAASAEVPTEETSTPAEPAPVVESTPVESTPVPETHVVTTPETTSTDNTFVGEETNEPAEDSGTMQTLFNSFTNNVKSYQFTYNNSKYSVLGARMKILLARPVQVREYTWPNGTKKAFFSYDTVYVDRSTQTAIAYCEGHLSRVNKACEELEILDYAYPVDYKHFNILLPQDWLLNYLPRDPTSIEANKYYVKGRNVLMLRFNETPLRTEIAMDPALGIPVRVEQYNQSRLIYRQEFDFLSSNKVRDVDVTHRSKEEIPSSEVFYNENIVNTPAADY